MPAASLALLEALINARCQRLACLQSTPKDTIRLAPPFSGAKKRLGARSLPAKKATFHLKACNSIYLSESWVSKGKHDRKDH